MRLQVSLSDFCKKHSDARMTSWNRNQRYTSISLVVFPLVSLRGSVHN